MEVEQRLRRQPLDRELERGARADELGRRGGGVVPVGYARVDAVAEYGQPARAVPQAV